MKDELDTGLMGEQIRDRVAFFPYPVTPDIAGMVSDRLHTRRKRKLIGMRALGLSFAVLLIVLSAAFAVPEVRAQLLEFLQIGAIRIGIELTPPPLELTSPSGKPEVTRRVRTVELATATPESRAPPLNLDGLMTLEEAQARAGFHLYLPIYPPDLGEPDWVYYQDLGGPVVLLVWRDPESPDQVGLSLMLLGPGAFAGKGSPRSIEFVTINGTQAVWLEGEHTLLFSGGEERPMQLVVEGNVLVWEAEGLTFRLESALPKAEAIRIAESMHIIP